MTIQKGDTVRIARVEIRNGYAKDFIRFIADAIDEKLPVIQVKSSGTKPVVVYFNGVHEEFAFDEVFKV